MMYELDQQKYLQVRMRESERTDRARTIRGEVNCIKQSELAN